jgi:type II secretory ATPase GspE/PulE/Tfp pilus assembly ATPase PilB-like protein
MKYIGTTFRLSALGSMHAIQELEAMALAAGLGTTTSPKKAGLGNNGRITGLWRARPGGCSQCNYIGYKGRVGIFEVLCTSNPIQHLLIAERPYQTIETAAMGEGMLTMQQDGFIKALCGETTIEEIVRVTQPGFIEASA